MVDKETVRRGYDDLAATYAEQRAANDGDLDVLRDFLADLGTPSRILDAGCGQGAPVLSHLAGTTGAVGLDISSEQLRQAAENAPAAELLQGDLTSLPLQDDAVDVVTAVHSIIHVPLAEHQRVVDEFARVLRPGGHLLLSEGPVEWCGTNPDWLDSGAEMQWNIAGATATRDQLARAGFTVTDEWAAVDELADGDATDGQGDDAADDPDWLFFAARLDG